MNIYVVRTGSDLTDAFVTHKDAIAHKENLNPKDRERTTIVCVPMHGLDGGGATIRESDDRKSYKS